MARNKAARQIVRKQLSAEEQARRYELNTQVRRATEVHRERLRAQQQQQQQQEQDK